MGCVSTRGFTLAELLGALAILAIIAVLAIPSLSGSDGPQKLDLAATEISHALQFVRGEAVRSGQPQAFSFASNGQVTLYALDNSGIAPVLDAILMHPVSKKSYQFNVLNAQHTTGIELAATPPPFAFESANGLNINSQLVYFNASGAPHFVDGSGVYYRLTSGRLALAVDGLQRSVILAPITGRVTVQ